MSQQVAEVVGELIAKGLTNEQIAKELNLCGGFCTKRLGYGPVQKSELVGAIRHLLVRRKAEAFERPSVVTDEHLKFLDTLRDSGVTNMWGGRLALQAAFPELSSKKAAAQVLLYWMSL